MALAIEMTWTKHPEKLPFRPRLCLQVRGARFEDVIVQPADYPRPGEEWEALIEDERGICHSGATPMEAAFELTVNEWGIDPPPLVNEVVGCQAPGHVRMTDAEIARAEADDLAAIEQLLYVVERGIRGQMGLRNFTTTVRSPRGQSIISALLWRLSDARSDMLKWRDADDMAEARAILDQREKDEQTDEKLRVEFAACDGR